MVEKESDRWFKKAMNSATMNERKCRAVTMTRKEIIKSLPMPCISLDS